MSKHTEHKHQVKLISERLVIRLAQQTDADSITQYYSDNKSYLATWEPHRTADFYQPKYWRTRLVEIEQKQCLELYFCFLLLNPNETEIYGLVDVTNAFAGAWPSYWLGYSLAQSKQGRGFMLEGLNQIIAYLQCIMHLHRLMACYLPSNLRSKRLLDSLGFKKEGIARAFMSIDGYWRDHIMCALICSKPSGRCK